MGASIAKAANKHTIRLIIAHMVRIILGLGNSVKSAPLIPLARDNAPKAKTMRRDSTKATRPVLNVGCKTATPTIPVIAVTRTEKKTMKKYLLFTKLLG